MRDSTAFIRGLPSPLLEVRQTSNPSSPTTSSIHDEPPRLIVLPRMKGDEMSKIIAFVIVTALTLLPISPNLSSPVNAAANEMEVMVLFNGLMVFHKKKNSEQYEVGILSQQYSAGHEFCIQR